jgi:hypothetical protein
MRGALPSVGAAAASPWRSAMRWSSRAAASLARADYSISPEMSMPASRSAGCASAISFRLRPVPQPISRTESASPRRSAAIARSRPNRMNLRDRSKI